MRIDDLIRQDERKLKAVNDCETAWKALKTAKVERDRAVFLAREAGCSIFDISLAAHVSTTRIYQIIREYEVLLNKPPVVDESLLTDAEWAAQFTKKPGTAHDINAK